MSAWKAHRYFGLILFLPIIAWSVTGMVFHIKPGYGDAYEILYPKTYAIEKTISLIPQEDWQEIRLLSTRKDDHLLVKTKEERLHLDPYTLAAKPQPNIEVVRGLIDDAIAHNRERYGQVTEVNGLSAVTTTGIVIKLDWTTLSFSQIGRDRKVIDTLYKIHYLQWTPWQAVNKIFSILGLVCLISLAVFGLKLFLYSRKKRAN